MQVTAIGNIDVRLGNWLLKKLQQSIDYCSRFFISLPDPHVTKSSKQSIDEIISQFVVNRFAVQDSRILFLPVQTRPPLAPQKLVHKIHLPKALINHSSRNHRLNLYKRSPHGGLALVRREERLSRPNRKPRRNGSR